MKKATGNADSGEGAAKVKHQRRSEREKRIALLGQQGDPLAGPALQLHKEVCKREDELDGMRTRLMAVLRGVK